MPKQWVINASPVILLSKAGLINHVPVVARPLVIPEPVAAEIRQCREVDAAVKWIEGAGKQFIRLPAKELDDLIKAGIGPGERAVIAWAAANPGFAAVLDDSEARIAARRLGARHGWGCPELESGWPYSRNQNSSIGNPPRGRLHERYPVQRSLASRWRMI